jgi:hypothetical protein
MAGFHSTGFHSIAGTRGIIYSLHNEIAVGRSEKTTITVNLGAPRKGRATHVKKRNNMKLTNTLALALISSIASLSAFAQAPAVQNGSSWSRAPLPSNRPADFVRVTRLAVNPSAPSQSVLVANHINGPVANQVVPALPTTQVVAVR